MKNTYILTFTLIMTGLWCLAYAHFFKYFSSPDRYQQQIQKLRNELEQNNLQKDLLVDQLIEFKMDVAKILPGILRQSPKGEKSYPLRSLASLVMAKDESYYKDSKMRRSLIAAKDLFANKKYKEAALSLKKFIVDYPFSINIAESFFLLAESYFQMEDYERSLLTIEKMIELFPQDELTGYAMIRMGKIYELQDRPEEAVDIYQTVLQVFPVRGLAAQARQSLSSLEL